MGKLSQWISDKMQWISDKIDGICPEPKPAMPTKEEMHALVADVEEATGAADYGRRILHAKDGNERKLIRTEWERKMSERGGRSFESHTR